MLRFSFSFIGCFVLFYVQCLIVMKLFHYETIYFEHPLQAVIICIINFFLLFSILTQLSPWFAKMKMVETEED